MVQHPRDVQGDLRIRQAEEIPNFGSMSDEDIIEFANTMSYYDRMDEGIEEEFTNVEDAMEYLRMTYEGE